MSSRLAVHRLAANHVLANLVMSLLAYFTTAMLAPSSGAAVDAPDVSQLISDLGLRVADTPVRERSQWQPPHKILLSPALFVHFHEDLAKLQQVAPDVKFIKLSTTTPADDIVDVDAAIGLCAPKMLQAAKRLQWIQWLGAGVEECVQQPLIRERQPLITNMQRTGGASMAEHVMGMMLVLSRHLNYFIAEQRRGHWDPDSDHYPFAVDLKGKTLLVVGLGGIGLEVAKRSYAFGMRITATRASRSARPDYVSYVGMPDELMKLTRDADFIINCTPLTPQTAGLFDKEFFNAVKPTAYFINVGRGGSVVTTDLIAALKARRIAGAGLDVTDPEPLPSSSSLWRMPNVLITPHVSSNSPLTDELRLAVLHENLRRYVAGDRMLSVVDIERGY